MYDSTTERFFRKPGPWTKYFERIKLYILEMQIKSKKEKNIRFFFGKSCSITYEKIVHWGTHIFIL